MSLKSLINASIIKSDLRRYWYMGVLFAAGLMLTAVLPAANTGVYTEIARDTVFETSRFASSAMVSLFAIIIFALVIPAIIFSYLHHKSAVNAAHCLPIRREGLYLSHIISSQILIIGALLINTLLMLTVCEAPAIYVLKWAGLSLVYCFVLSAFSSMASMIVGNTAAGIVLPSIVIALPAFIYAVFQFLCDQYLYGYTYESSPDILKYIYQDYSVMLDGWLLLYLALGVFFFILGLVCYKKRALENNSRILAFDFVNPLFLYSFSICLGLLGYIYINEVTNIDTLWIALPFGIAGVIIAKMIINKSFKPKGFVVPAIVYCVMMFIVYTFFGFDITGFEKRVPPLDEVASVSVTYPYNGDYAYADTYVDDETILIAPDAVYDPTIRDKKDIEKVLALHTKIIENHKSSNMWKTYNIPILYTLNNGKQLRRSYSFDIDDELYKLYGEVMNTECVKADRFPIISDVDREYTLAEVSTLNFERTILSPEQLNQITEALKKDVRASSFEDYHEKSSVTVVNLTCRIPSIYENGEKITDKSKWITSNASYNVYPSYTNTVVLLKEWELYKKMPTAEDVQSITVHNPPSGDNEIADKAKIQELLDYIANNEEKLGNDFRYDKDIKRQRITIRYNNNSIEDIAIIK